MCDYRIDEYCFNPKYLEKGILAKHITEMPCCNGQEKIIKK
ncbi:MAG: hypothetical protein QXG00_03975 [Candidatus Woesearchaeota archaeon]